MKKNFKKSVEVVMNEIKAQIAVIGRERDKLRDLIEEAQAVIETCDDAKYDFERGLDTMSQYV